MKKIVLPLSCIAAAAVVAGGLFVMGRGISDTEQGQKQHTEVDAATLFADVQKSDSAEQETALKDTQGEDYSLTVKFRNGEEKIQGIFTDQAEMKNSGGSTEAGWQTVSTPEGAFYYKEEDLTNMVNGFSEMQDSNMTQPVNAHIEKADGGFQIVPETEGTSLNKDAAMNAVEEAVSKDQSELDLTGVSGVYNNPAVTSTDAALNQQLAALNNTITASITYTLPGTTQTLDGATTINWLTQNADRTWTKDDATWNAHIADYVAQMAADTDTINKDKTFSATGIGDITVRGTGYYGYQINQEAEIAQLTDELNTGTVTTRQPVYSFTEASTPDDNYGFGQNYVEADLSRQHIWVYVNGKVAYETDCVSGTMNESYYTPDGAFIILNKEQNATLLGDQIAGKENYYTYTQPVSYWMPFTYSGCGMHDAVWRSSFGSDIYIANGSHGCLNLSLDAAAQIYNLVSVREPMVVYYSAGYTLAPAPAPVQTEGVYYDRNAQNS
ncbi:MAG: L,D-transpeptidase family protein [Bilifractor sp.]